MIPEFSRPERCDSIGDQPRAIAIVADATERARLAARFGLIAINRLDARFTVRRDAGGIAVAGRIEAEVIQACSVTGDPVAATIDEPVSLRFVEAAEIREEIDLDDESLDTVEIDGDAIDLGETAAETLALALDPFPRGPGASAALKAAGVVSDDEARPFSGLAALKDLLAR